LPPRLVEPERAELLRLVEPDLADDFLVDPDLAELLRLVDPDLAAFLRELEA